MVPDSIPGNDSSVYTDVCHCIKNDIMALTAYIHTSLIHSFPIKKPALSIRPSFSIMMRRVS